MCYVCIYIYLFIFIYVYYTYACAYMMRIFLSLFLFSHPSRSSSFKPLVSLSLSLSLSLSPSLFCSSLYRSPLVPPWQTANRPPNTPNTLFLGCLRGAFSAFCRLNSDPRNKLAADHGGICLLDNLFPSPRGPRVLRLRGPVLPFFFLASVAPRFRPCRERKGRSALLFQLSFSSFERLHLPLHPSNPFHSPPPVLSSSYFSFSLPSFLSFFSRIVLSPFRCERMGPISKVQEDEGIPRNSRWNFLACTRM